jgi:hypothetical protein
MTQNERHSVPNKTDEAETGKREHDAPLTGAVYHTDSGDETGICRQCGHPLQSSGFEEILGSLGITEEMVSSLKIQLQNLDVGEYLNVAREYLKPSDETIPLYVKENPAKVAVGFAALALGAGLVWSFAHQTRPAESEDRLRQLELKRALAGPKYPLDEVLSELGVAV